MQMLRCDTSSAGLVMLQAGMDMFRVDGELCCLLPDRHSSMFKRLVCGLRVCRHGPLGLHALLFACPKVAAAVVHVAH